jgi:hypothetical protein
MAKDSDKDFALFYKSKLDEAIDSDDKEGMKRWSQELIDHYTTDADSELTIGKHDDVPDSEFDAEELAKGIKVEMEHTDDLEIAKSIAKDHLSEAKNYYTRLLKMEAEAKTKDESPVYTQGDYSIYLDGNENKYLVFLKGEPRAIAAKESLNAAKEAIAEDKKRYNANKFNSYGGR